MRDASATRYAFCRARSDKIISKHAPVRDRPQTVPDEDFAPSISRGRIVLENLWANKNCHKQACQLGANEGTARASYLDNCMVLFRQRLVLADDCANGACSVPPNDRIVKQSKQPIREALSECVAARQKRFGYLSTTISSIPGRVDATTRTHVQAAMARLRVSGGCAGAAT